MTTTTFATERDELGWFYAQTGQVIGLHAAGLERSGGVSVYDDHAQERAHASRRSRRHRNDVARMALVERVLAELSAEQRADLAAAFTPFGAARATHQLQSAMAREGQALLGLALRTRAVARLVEGDDEAPPSSSVTLRVLEHDASRLPLGNRIPTDHRLAKILDEAWARLDRALAAYAAARAPLAPPRETFAQRQERRLDELVALERLARGVSA